MYTETEYLQCTPNMTNDKYLPCSCFIMDKKRKKYSSTYIKVRAE